LILWCKTHQPQEVPSSPMGVAIRYLLNPKEALCRFLEDGDIPIDNGAVERFHVRTALRKNFLFAGSDAGAERAAIVYSVIATCKLADVNPNEYLADVLPRLSRRIRMSDMHELLPQEWKARRSQRSPSEMPA
jgi:transposase